MKTTKNLMFISIFSIFVLSVLRGDKSCCNDDLYTKAYACSEPVYGNVQVCRFFRFVSNFPVFENASTKKNIF